MIGDAREYGGHAAQHTGYGARIIRALHRTFFVIVTLSFAAADARAQSAPLPPQAPSAASTPPPSAASAHAQAPLPPVPCSAAGTDEHSNSRLLPPEQPPSAAVPDAQGSNAPQPSSASKDAHENSAPLPPPSAAITEAHDGSAPLPSGPPLPAAPNDAHRGVAGRVLPIAAALVLGPIAHGAGHFVAGKPGTGRALLALEGIGLLAAGAGLGGLAVTGASERTVALIAGVSALGVGLFATSYLADLYGVIAPPGGFGQAVLRPAWTAEVGMFRVVDPVFKYDALAYLNSRAFVDRHSLLVEGYLGLDHDNQRLRGIYANRFIEVDAATYLEAELGVVHHRFAPEQFSMTFAEFALSGRLELGHISPTLQGAFVDGSFGLAFGSHRYFGLASEFDNMLLMRLAFGFFIGDGGSWNIYYDHRHDGYAAGMKMPGIPSGVLGHVGTALQYYFSSEWGVGLRAESGSAHVIGVSLLFRRKQW